jgi:hypothetical protein
MEITNEIKEKIFFQYLGIQFKSGNVIGRFKPKTLDYFGYSIKIILKPLSSITDEDARVMAVLNGAVFGPGDISFESEGFFGVRIRNDKDGIGNPVKDRFIMWDQLTLPVFQFLQSEGYDLPQYLLGGKTLHEAGLAIYESEIPTP